MAKNLSWKAQCITLKNHGKPYGYIAMAKENTCPSLGGLRILERKYNPASLSLCLQLAKTMQLKAEYANLPLSGGKAVIHIPSSKERKYFLRKLADDINCLQGQYITSVDIGSSQDDMDFLHQYTKHLTSYTSVGGDPSFYTAQTVLLSIKAACDFYFQDASLDSKHIVIQGIGKVGSQLLTLLRKQSSQLKITITDTDMSKLSFYASEYVADTCHPSEVYSVKSDVFISAANSHIIGASEIKQLRCHIFAAAANNPFKGGCIEGLMKERGIVLLPDYLINSGGLIYCAYQYYKTFDLEKKIRDTYQSVSRYLDFSCCI